MNTFSMNGRLQWFYFRIPRPGFRAGPGLLITRGKPSFSERQGFTKPLFVVFGWRFMFLPALP